MKHQSGRHFLQIPGPDQRAGARAARDRQRHRGPPRARIPGDEHGSARGPEARLQDQEPGRDLPASGTGAWEAALVNTLSPGDRVLMVETGHFATLWQNMANKLGLTPEFIKGDWRHGADPAAIEARLADDTKREIKAVCVVHNETSTGVVSRIGEVRKAIDRAKHPGALHGGHHLLARLHRLPPRRMGRGCHRRRLAEGPDAAARALVQRRIRQGARRVEIREAAALLLELGGDDRRQQGRLVPVHAGDEPALRPARRAEDAAGRGRARKRLQAPRPPRRGDAPRGARVGARDPVREPRRVLELAHRGADAGGPQRDRVPARWCSTTSTFRSAPG